MTVSVDLISLLQELRAVHLNTLQESKCLLGKKASLIYSWPVFTPWYQLDQDLDKAITHDMTDPLVRAIMEHRP